MRQRNREQYPWRHAWFVNYWPWSQEQNFRIELWELSVTLKMNLVLIFDTIFALPRLEQSSYYMVFTFKVQVLPLSSVLWSFPKETHRLIPLGWPASVQVPHFYCFGSSVSWKEMLKGFGINQGWTRYLSPSSCVVWDNLLYISAPEFLHLKNQKINQKMGYCGNEVHKMPSEQWLPKK